METPFQIKCDGVKNRLQGLPSQKRYQYLMELGKNLGAYPDEYKLEENLVSGCQSKLYLRSFEKDGKIYFQAHSDALISKGLAALLIEIYSGETVETILTSPPDFVNELGMIASLSMNRSNGFSNILLKMKQESLKHLSSLAL